MALRVRRGLDERIGAGKAAAKAAPRVTSPALIVQGTEDEAVRPEKTRQLLQAFPGPIQYRELPTGHELIQSDNPYYAQLADAALRFSAELAA